ncbi:MAG: sensor histidine kinase [Thermoanaerobaculia bacterium]
MNDEQGPRTTFHWVDRARHSLGGKLLVLLLGSLVVVFAILGFLNIHLHRASLETTTLAAAQRVSDMIARSTSYYMLRNDREGLYHIITTAGTEPGVGGIRVYNPQGRVSFSTEPSDIGTQLDVTAPTCKGCHGSDTPLTQLDQDHRFRIYERGGERYLGVITPIHNSPTCSSGDCHAHPPEQAVLGVFDVSLSLAAPDANVRESTIEMLIVTAIGILAVAMITSLFVYRLVHLPVKQLSLATHRLTAGDLGHQIDVTPRDELGDLASSFNTMSRELGEAREENVAWTRTLESRVEQKTAELRRAHEQMLQAEKLASLGKLSAVVAHEINNPLSSILTYSKLLRKWIERGDSMEDRATDFKESLALIETESKRCGDIVKNLLTFARQAPMNIQWVDLNAIFKQCVKLIDHKLDLGGIALRLELEEGLPPVHGDIAQLEQLLLALIINAIDAMPQGGNLHLATSSDEKEIRAVIEDDGMGIPAELLPRLFEPFVTTKEHGKGVGLGLAISRSIVERHRGRIDVASEANRGTTFTIILPRDLEELAPRPPEPVETTGAPA